MNAFDLAPNEIDSEVWRKVKRRLEEKLEAARKRLENPKLSHDETQAVRGEIKALKDLLALQDRAVIMTEA